MALLFMDSFDHYATADLTKKWTSIGTVVAGAPYYPAIVAKGRRSSQSVEFKIPVAHSTQAACAPITRTLAPADNVCIVGMGVKWSAFTGLLVKPNSYECYNSGTSGSNYLVKCMLINDERWFARVNLDGTISILTDDGSDACPVLGTTSGALQAGIYCYVEFKVTVHRTLGTVDVSINGDPVLSLTNVNTRGGAGDDTWNNIRVGYFAPNEPYLEYTLNVDDLYVFDGSGTYNNDVVGDVSIGVIRPDEPGATTEWDDSTGGSPPDNWANVDETLVNDDTDYNSTNVLDAQDTYEMEDVPIGADVRAIQVVTATRKSSEGAGKIKHVVRSAAADYLSADISVVGTSYAFDRSIWEVDPATNAPWTESGINAVEVGLVKTE